MTYNGSEVKYIRASILSDYGFLGTQIFEGTRKLSKKASSDETRT